MTQRLSLTVQCPQCLARSGKPCRSCSGRPGPAHKARVMSAYHVVVREHSPSAIGRLGAPMTLRG
jgi:hypothetical protein